MRHYLGENLTGHHSDVSGHHLNSWDQLQQTENEQSTAFSPPCSKLPSMDTCSLTLKFYFDSRLAPASVSLPPPPQNSQSINFSRSLSIFLICEPFSFRCSFRGGGRTIRWTSFAKHTFQSDSRHSSRPVQWNYLVLAISLQQSVNWSPPLSTRVNIAGVLSFGQQLAASRWNSDQAVHANYWGSQLRQVFSSIYHGITVLRWITNK